MNKLIAILLLTTTLFAQQNLSPLPPRPLVVQLPPVSVGYPIYAPFFSYVTHTLTAAQIYQTAVELKWNKSVNGPIGLGIDVSMDGLNFKQIENSNLLFTCKNVPPYDNSCLIRGLRADTLYYFRVREIFNDTVYCNHNVLQVKTLQFAPVEPSNLRFQTIEPKLVVLQWVDNSSNEDGFIVERSASNEDNYEQIIVTPPNATSLSDYGVHPNTFYYYRVKAFNNGGESGYTKFKLATLPDDGSVRPLLVREMRR